MTNFTKLALLVSALSGASLMNVSCNPKKSESNPDAVVGVLASDSINYQKTTRILVIGYSHGMGDFFAKSALSRAKRYLELYPNEQIVVMGRADVGGGVSDTQALTKLGVKVLSDTEDVANTQYIMKQFLKYSSISSIDFYTHSSAWSIGVDGDDPVNRLGVWSDPALVGSLQSHFTSGAYVTLNGCNAGAEAAPFLSKLWKVPVSGGLTGSNSQELHNNGNWYFNDEGLFPSGGFASKNAVSYATHQSCSKGACARFKPSNSSYSGYWGTLAGGSLGFYKFFCNYEGDMSRCKTNIARSLLSFPSTKNLSLKPSRADFEAVILDYICPNDSQSAKRADCFEKLPKVVANGSMVYSSLRGNALKCDLKRCGVEFKCKKDSYGRPLPGTCTTTAQTNNNPTTQAEEYKLFMEGYDLLMNENGGGTTSPVINPTTAPTVAPTTIATSGFPKICSTKASDNISNVRSTPEGTLLLGLKNGTSVKVVKEQNGWSAVEFASGGVQYGEANGKPAWISSKLVICN